MSNLRDARSQLNVVFKLEDTSHQCPGCTTSKAHDYDHDEVWLPLAVHLHFQRVGDAHFKLAVTS